MRICRIAVVLWARGFISTNETCTQCISRASSPGARERRLFRVCGLPGYAATGVRHAGSMMSVVRRGFAAAALAAAVTMSPMSAAQVSAGGVATAASDSSPSSAPEDLAALGWIWPVEPFRLAAPFVAPPHEYGPGHRGIDLEPLGTADLRSPADGVVAFSGAVAGRGVLTIDHGGGLVTTLEPVASELTPGTAVRRGEPVAVVATGGHSAEGTVHFGVRLHGAYINPMLLLGGVPRAVLLPCCD